MPQFTSMAKLQRSFEANSQVGCGNRNLWENEVLLRRTITRNVVFRLQMWLRDGITSYKICLLFAYYFQLLLFTIIVIQTTTNTKIESVFLYFNSSMKWENHLLWNSSMQTSLEPDL